MEIKDFFKKSYIQLAILFLTLAIYLFTSNPIFGVLIALEIFSMVILEILEGKEKHGWKGEFKDTLIAILIAVGIWFGAQFLLHTNSPVSAVVTCSMLPNLQRGDFAIIQGAEPVNINKLHITKNDLESLKSDPILTIGDNEAVVKGSIYSYCIFIGDPLCKNFTSSPEEFKEVRGKFKFNYGQCVEEVKDSGEISQPCIKSVEFEGKNYTQSINNDILVYQPAKTDLFSLNGDIIHRGYFELVVDGTEERYYLTKGDNNPVFDIQIYDYGRGIGNSVVSADNVKGKMIFKVPLIGYFKLFISGFFQEPAQCKTILHSFD